MDCEDEQIEASRPQLNVRDLTFLALGALLVRVLYFSSHSLSPFFGQAFLDQTYYDTFARAILEGRDLSGFGGFRPMLYPYFVAACYRIGGGMGFATFVQHLLGVLTVLMTARIAASLYRSRLTGLVAGGLLALAGPVVFFEGELMIVTLLTLLLVGMNFTLATGWERAAFPSLPRWAIAGLLLGLAAQARPNVLVVYPAALCFAAGACWFRRDTRSLAPVAAFLAAAFLVQVLFGLLGREQAGRFQLLTAAGGINLYVGNGHRADGMTPKQSASVTYQERYRDSIEVYAEQGYLQAMQAEGREPDLRPAVISDFWKQKTLEEIREDPGRWIGLMLRKTWFLVWNREIPNNKSYAFNAQHESLLLRLLPVRWGLLMALLPAGLWAWWRRGERGLGCWLGLVALCYAGGILLFFVNARFRLPLYPFACMAAAGGAVWLVEHYRSGERKSLVGPALAGLALFGLSVINVFGIPPENPARDFFFRSKAYLQRGHFEAARRDIEQSLEHDPHAPDAAFQQGNVFFALERWEDARAVFARATELEPNEFRAWNNRGAAAERCGRIDEARAHFLRALEIFPGHRESRINLVMLEVRAGRLEAARAAFEPLQDEAMADVLVLQAEFARLGGRGEEAEAYWRRALAQDEGTARWMQGQVQRPPDGP